MIAGVDFFVIIKTTTAVLPLTARLPLGLLSSIISKLQTELNGFRAATIFGLNPFVSVESCQYFTLTNTLEPRVSLLW